MNVSGGRGACTEASGQKTRCALFESVPSGGRLARSAEKSNSASRGACQAPESLAVDRVPWGGVAGAVDHRSIAGLWPG